MAMESGGANTLEVRAACLRAARAAAGMMQDEAARKAGIAANTLLDAEMGRRISGKTWRALQFCYEKNGVRIEEQKVIITAVIVSSEPPTRG